MTPTDQEDIPRECHTLREIDEGLGLAKGSAFRAFKSLALREDSDFRVLHPDRDPAVFQALRSAGRIYAGTQRAILLCDTARAQVEAILRGGPDDA